MNLRMSSSLRVPRKDFRLNVWSCFRKRANEVRLVSAIAFYYNKVINFDTPTSSSWSLICAVLFNPEIPVHKQPSLQSLPCSLPIELHSLISVSPCLKHNGIIGYNMQHNNYLMDEFPYCTPALAVN